MMILIILALVVISFILAAISLRDYKGTTRFHEVKEQLHKEKIKGAIVFDDKDNVTHYSSYS